MADTRTILIADDDRATAAALKARCAKLGVNTVVAYDALSTVLKVKEMLPDLICLDVNMPGGNGLHVCEMLAFDARRTRFPLIGKAIPMIVLTGRTDVETTRACEELGVHYVPKGRNLWDRLEPLIKQLLGINAEGATPLPPDVPDFPRSPPPTHGKRANAARGSFRTWEGAASSVEASSASPEPIREGTAVAPRGGSGERQILVIEDDRGVVEIIRQFLEPHEFNIVHCQSLEEARKSVTAAAAVLCDVHIPGTRGTFIIRELRAEGYDGPIIVITGDSTPVTVMECARSRISGILLKPFGRQELLAKLAGVDTASAAAGRFKTNLRKGGRGGSEAESAGRIAAPV